MFTIIKYLKLKKSLDNIYDNENLIDNLSGLFNSQFKKDWVGRLYTVVNPSIDENGNYNLSNQIFEFTEDGMVNHSYVEKFIMDKLVAAEQFIKTNNLFDMLQMRIKKIDDMGNFLFILQPYMFDNFKKHLKITSIVSVILLIALVIGIVILKKYNLI